MIGEDPAADRVLEAAFRCEAEAILSGDRHLLRLGPWEGIRIVKATALLAELGIDA